VFFRGVEGAAPYRCLRGEIKKKGTRVFVCFYCGISQTVGEATQDAIKREERGRF
jgi:hypothetical protein